jgi:glycerophosphoryl diester phosphodiesterase
MSKEVNMDYGVQIPELLRTRQKSPFVIAHRGNRAQAPENSMAAFRLALEQGAHALETDLRITRDRQVVCIHDATLDRTTDGTGSVADMTLKEIRQARLTGAGDDGYPDERVPTLDELLEAFADRSYFLLEFKDPAFSQPEDVPLLLEALKRHNALDKVIIASFSTEILDNILAHAGYPFISAPIIATNPWPPAKYPMLGVWYPMLFLNPLYVWIAHRRGQVFCPLDATPEPRLRYYLRLGVDCVLTDDPQKTIAALKELTGSRAAL